MKLTHQSALKITTLIGAAAVAMGAFGAHALKDLLIDSGRLDTWETAVFYHLTHAIVLLVLASIKPWRRRVWLIMAAGILIFSGSLYLLCLTGVTWLGAVTPIGGLLLIAGWLGMFMD